MEASSVVEKVPTSSEFDKAVLRQLKFQHQINLSFPANLPSTPRPLPVFTWLGSRILREQRHAVNESKDRDGKRTPSIQSEEE